MRITIALIAVYFAVAASICFASARPVTDDTFYDEVKRTYDPVVVEFWASYCPSCRRAAPVVEDLAREYEGRVKVLKMDTQANGDTARQYAIERIPTFVYFKDGYEVARATGSMSKEDLKEKLGLP